MEKLITGNLITNDIVYFEREDLVNGTVDPAFILNGKDYIDIPFKDGWDALEAAKLTKDNDFIIPKDTIVEKMIETGGANEYHLLTPNGNKLIIDMCLDD